MNGFSLGVSWDLSGESASCSLTRSMKASVELPDGLFDNEASGAITIVASKSDSATSSMSSSGSSGNSASGSSGNSASVSSGMTSGMSSGMSSGIGKVSVNSMSIGCNGGMLSSFSIESDIGMGADPSGAAGGRAAGSISAGRAMSGMGAEPNGEDGGFATCELSTPGIGAEPSDEVGGARRAGSSVCSAVFAAGAGADANGDGLSKTPDVMPASAVVSLAGSD